MQLERLISFFSTNPTAKLLSSPHAPYIVFFLSQHFKIEQRLTSPQSELLDRLSLFLEQVHATSPDVLRDRAENYLANWSTGDTRWLRRYFDADHSESVYQLTPHTEDVLKFLTEVLDRPLGFVGTESRLSRIIETLSDIVIRGSDDPQRRLQHLRAERQHIEDEIQSIESGEGVSTYSPTAIRERFADVVSDLVSLQGDFRAVEESFRTITRDVQRQQTEATDSRGNILGFALDAEDRLKEEDQGASFQAFVRLILSQAQQDELEQMIQRLDEIDELAQQVDGKTRVQMMISSLSAEAEKVLRTIRRLSMTLRRLLDSRSSTTRLRLATVLREIKAAAARRAEAPPTFGVDVYSQLELLNISQRTFWESPVRFAEVEVSHQAPDDDDRLLAFRPLAEMQRLDWDALRGNIAEQLREKERVTLPQMLADLPTACDAVEVLGYIQLAHDQGDEVDQQHVDIVYVEDPDSDTEARPYEVPRVVFRRVNQTALHIEGEQS